MSGPRVIRRDEKLRRLTALLEQRRVVYLSSFFYSGKSLLLDALERELTRPVLRFAVSADDWAAFAASVWAAPGCAILIDDADRLDDDLLAGPVSALLEGLPEDRCAVLTGRAQLPPGLQKLCVGGGMEVLGQDFVLFDEDEIGRLFEAYGQPLRPAEIAYIKERYWGWPIAMHAIARRMRANPGASVRALWEGLSVEFEQLMNSDVLSAFPEEERLLLFALAPFERFTADMARMVTGRRDAPRMLAALARRSYMLLDDGPDRYRFFPIVRRALMREARNLYSPEYFDDQYRRAALYHELQGQISQAIDYYIRLDDREKIRQLLIRDTYSRPANGDYVALRRAYALLSEQTLLASPELMKGMSMIEGMLDRPEESERWYAALKDFLRQLPPRDGRRAAAREALAYLDIALPQRGSGRMLHILTATAGMKAVTGSDSWRGGFNVAGNWVSLLDGGKDFCRWVPHGRGIYRLLRAPIELALGGGTGMGDIAIGECLLESELSGDYGEALDLVCAGLSRVSNDLELRCAGAGIQSRILAAQGGMAEALDLVEGLIAALPEDAPPRLRQNLEVHRLTLLLNRGEHGEALDWLRDAAPDETGDFIILDRYRYMLKLRLYIISEQWERLPLLAAKLRHYFDGYDRPYQRVKLRLLQAVAIHRTGGEGWRQELEAALALAKRYRLARVIADEGIAVVELLSALELPDSPWEQAVLRLTRDQAARYPGYLKSAAHRPVFTQREDQVYRLLVAGYRNAKIASVLSITERTVKHHTAEIYRKLGVSTRAEAMNRAAELGDIK